MMNHLTEDLEQLARRIHGVTSRGKRYKIAGGHEYALLRGLPRDELQAVARAARCHLVVRMGGSIIEFTRSGAATGTVPTPA